VTDINISTFALILLVSNYNYRAEYGLILFCDNNSPLPSMQQQKSSRFSGADESWMEKQSVRL